MLKLNTTLLFSQEAEKLFSVDFPFAIDRLSGDLTDDKLTTLVGGPLLQELDSVSVEPIKAVSELSKGMVQDNKS